MPFQMIFGDDEHTAADGPYKRVLATRKWLYVGAAMAIVLAHGFYDDHAAAKLLKVIQLPAWLARYFVLGSEIYLVIQYGLLLFQLLTVYDLVLRERFIQRRQEEVTAARQRFEAVEKEYKYAAKELWSAQSSNPQTGHLPEFEARVPRLKVEAELAGAALERLMTMEPSKRRGYQAMEKLIDGLRVIPPLLVALVAITQLLRHMG